jgi:hypothetical protein
MGLVLVVSFTNSSDTTEHGSHFHARALEERLTIARKVTSSKALNSSFIPVAASSMRSTSRWPSEDVIWLRSCAPKRPSAWMGGLRSWLAAAGKRDLC